MRAASMSDTTCSSLSIFSTTGDVLASMRKRLEAHPCRYRQFLSKVARADLAGKQLFIKIDFLGIVRHEAVITWVESR